MTPRPVVPDVLRLDPETACARIEAAVRDQVQALHRKGVVLGLSGGIDSSTAAGLCVRALGRDRVLGILMPEADGSDESQSLGLRAAASLGIRAVTENITGILEAAGCYKRRDEAIRTVMPEYGEGFKCKLVFANVLDRPGYALPSLVVQPPGGEQLRVRLTPEAYLGILAATNFKQRTRKMIEYYHADRLQYAVAGTPNRLEYDQGFFVKNGDGAADLKPIAHLYKTQVYQLAEHLGVPEEIRSRHPTTDTYSLAQSQEEFYFSLPFTQMDLCLHGRNAGLEPSEVARQAGLTTEQVRRVYDDIDAKRKVTRYLHQKPMLVEPIREITA